MTERAPLPSFCLDLPIHGAWPCVTRLHHAVVSCLAAVVPDAELCDAVGMIASELCENAIKYSDWSCSGEARLVLRPSAAPLRDSVEVEVSNPIAGHASYESVREALDWIARFPSPREAYVARLRAILADDACAQGSRLGFIRILCEGGGQVDAELVDGRVLRMRATVRVASTCC